MSFLPRSVAAPLGIARDVHTRTIFLGASLELATSIFPSWRNNVIDLHLFKNVLQS